MSTIELKANLHQLIDAIEDNKVLNSIYILLTRQLSVNESVDFWDELPEDVKNDIEEAIKEAERGEIFSHQSVVNELKAHYNIEL
ncbi:MAG: hypothetical protein U0W24_12730 [Bacteroidales bacterium]